MHSKITHTFVLRKNLVITINFFNNPFFQLTAPKHNIYTINDSENINRSTTTALKMDHSVLLHSAVRRFEEIFLCDFITLTFSSMLETCVLRNIFDRSRARFISRISPANVRIAIYSWVMDQNTGVIEKEFEAGGSGVIIHSCGRILTNEHVINKANKPGLEKKVILQDGREYDYLEEILDKECDLATILIREEGLPVVAFGTSSKVSIGDRVVAVGCPRYLLNTHTFGKISHPSRQTTEIFGHPPTSVPTFIQTDAAINPGNSGGGLYDR